MAVRSLHNHVNGSLRGSGPVTADPGSGEMSTDSGNRPFRRRERRRELALGALALAVAAAADRAVAAGTGRADYGWLQLSGLTLVLLTLSAHLGLRRWAAAADPLLLPVVVAINGLGLAEIHRLDLAAQAAAALGHRHVPAAQAPLQLVWTGLGVGLFLITMTVVRDHRSLARLTYTFGLVGLVLLIMPAVLPARFSEVNGAKLWIRFGGLSFQPAEFGKVTLLVFFAGYLTSKRDSLLILSRRLFHFPVPRGRDAGPLLGVWAVTLIVLFLSTI